MKGKIRINNTCVKVFSFIFCIFIVLCLSKVNFSDIKILQDDFLITFMISLIGIFLAILTLMYGLLEKIATIFSTANITTSLKNIYKSFDEIKDNTLLIFYLMLSIFIIALLGNIDIPYIKLPENFTKTNIIYNIKICILILVLFSVYDTIKTFFIILNISRNNK